MKVLVREFSCRGRVFTIIKGDDGYTKAIDHKYLDSEGRLTQTLNGLQMYVDTKDQSLGSMLERIQFQLELDDYIAESGIDKDDDYALARVIHEFYKARCRV